MSSAKGKFPSISIKRKPKPTFVTSSQLPSTSTSQSETFRPVTPDLSSRVLSGEIGSNNAHDNTISSIQDKENDFEAIESPANSSSQFSEPKVICRSPRTQIRSLNHRESLTSLGHDRSGSVNSETSDLIELPMVDQEDIIALTFHVRAFSEALGALRNTFSEDSESHVDSKPPEVKAHERLGEVLSILKGVLKQYEPLHSRDILAAAGTLINKVKSHNYEESDQPPEEFYESIDKLALAFSSSVSDFLMGDQDLGLSGSRENSRSLEDFADDDEDDLDEDDGDEIDDDDDDYRDDRKPFDKKEGQRDISHHKANELDKTLFHLEHGVDLTLQRTKVWSKYAKDIATYLERRAHLELEFTNKLAKLAQATRASITEDRHLPFQTIYVTSLDQDIEYAEFCARTYSSLLSTKFLEPLQHRRTSHEKKRKDLKDLWTKAYKKLNDAIGKLEKAKQSYIQKQQEIEKFKSSDTTQKRKVQEEVRKAEEAEEWYKQCVSEANVRQRELLKTKRHVLVELRQLIYQCDQTMKAVTCNFFQLMHTQSTPAPIRFQCLAETSRTYEPGCQFSDFVYEQIETAQPTVEREFVFESYSSSDKHHTHSRSNSDGGRSTSPFNSGRSNSGSQLIPPGKHFSHVLPDHLSDAESTGSKSAPATPDGSPIIKPKFVHRRVNDDSSDDESTTEVDVSKPSSGPFQNSRMSADAKTHNFKKLRAPSRCRGCDSYVYFNGAECSECGLSCHRKCLARITVRCDKKRGSGSRSSDSNGGRRMTTFGVDFYSHLQATRKDRECVPYIVSSCIEEINSRGLKFKGIYRVSGVKSKVEKVCQEFENNNGTVDLSSTPPHVIASVLKLYLRQLPEPLLTFQLYQEFINIAKTDSPEDHGSNEYKEVINKLREVVVKLPRANFKTAAKIITHLKLIAVNEDENQMSACNLGIVFGPTLLRPRESASTDSVSMSALVDMAHQAKAVELLINNPQVFDSPGIDDPASQDAPVEEFNRVKNESISSDVRSIRSRDSTSSQGVFAADDGSSDTAHDDVIDQMPENVLSDEPVNTRYADNKLISSKMSASPSKRPGIDSGFLDLPEKSHSRPQEKDDEYAMPEFLLQEETKGQPKDTDESNDDSTQGTSGFCTPDDDLGSSKGSLNKDDSKVPKSPTSLSPNEKVSFQLSSSSSLPDIATAMSRRSSGYSFASTTVSFGSVLPDDQLLPDHSENAETKPTIPEVPDENNLGYIRPYPNKTVDDSSVPSRTRARPGGLGFLKRNSDLPGKMSRLGIFPLLAKSSGSETDVSRKTHQLDQEVLLNTPGSTPKKRTTGISEALREMHIVYDPVLHGADNMKIALENQQEEKPIASEPTEERKTPGKEWYMSEQDGIPELDDKDNNIEFVAKENQVSSEDDGLNASASPLVGDSTPRKEYAECDDKASNGLYKMDDNVREEARTSEIEKDIENYNAVEEDSKIVNKAASDECSKPSGSQDKTEVIVSQEVRDKIRKSPRVSVKDRRRQYESPSSDEQSSETPEAIRKPQSPIGNIDLASRKQFFESIEKSTKMDETFKKPNDASRKTLSSSASSSKDDLDQVEEITVTPKLSFGRLDSLEQHSRAENPDGSFITGRSKEPVKLTSRRVDILLDDENTHDIQKYEKKTLHATNSCPLAQKSPKLSRRARRQFPEEKTQEDRQPQFV